MDAGSVVPPPCALELSPATVTLRVGASAQITLGGEGWDEVSFDTSQLLEVEAAEQGLSVTAGYALGAERLRFVAQCDDREVEAHLEVEVQALEIVPASTWTSGVDGPPAREYFSMWVDPVAADRLWVLGGFLYEPRQFTPGLDVWSLDLSAGRWTQHAEGPGDVLPGAGLAYRPDGFTLRYGGLNFRQLADPSQVPFVLHEVRTSTDGLQVSRLEPDPLPPYGDYQPSFFYHPASGRFLSACGLNAFGPHCRVAAFDPGTGGWSDVSTAGEAPAGRNGHFWAYDPASDRLVVFAGEGQPSSATCTACLSDTWALQLGEDPPRWVKLAEDGGPEGNVGRRNGGYVLDPLNHRLLVWGGTPDGRSTAEGLFALDLRPGKEAWHEVPLEGEAPSRSSSAMVFDAARGRVLAGFGNGASGIHADLWSIDVR